MSSSTRPELEIIELIANNSFFEGDLQIGETVVTYYDVRDYLVAKELELEGPVTTPGCLALVIRLYTHKDQSLYESLPFGLSYLEMIRECLDDKGTVFVTKSNYLKYGQAVIAAAQYSTRECYGLEGFVDDVISRDQHHLIPYDDKSIAKVLDRVHYLKTQHPILWEDYLEFYYYDCGYFEPLVCCMAGSNMSKELMIRVLEAVPDCQLADFFNKYGNDILELKIDLADPYNLPYTLGLPVYNTSIILEAIAPKLVELSKDPEAYIQSIVAINRANLEMFKQRLSGITSKEVKVYNEENCCGELVENYHPDRIFRYAEDEFIYQFTPPEFGILVDKKQNFWNRNPIPKVQIAMLKQFLDNSQHFEGKECEPITELIGNLTQRHDLEKTIRDSYELPSCYVEHTVASVQRLIDDDDELMLVDSSDDEYEPYSSGDELVHEIHAQAIVDNLGISNAQDRDTVRTKLETEWLPRIGFRKMLTFVDSDYHVIRNTILDVIGRNGPPIGEVDRDEVDMLDQFFEQISLTLRNVYRVSSGQHPHVDILRRLQYLVNLVIEHNRWWVQNNLDRLANEPVKLHVSIVQMNLTDGASIRTYVLGNDGETYNVSVEDYTGNITILPANDIRIRRDQYTISQVFELFMNIKNNLPTCREPRVYSYQELLP